MTSQGGRDAPEQKPPASFLLALIPWACFEISVFVTAMWGDPVSLPLSGMVMTAPAYLAFVALPAWLPLATARHRLTCIAALVAMTATAVTAGIAMASSNDAQAGLAVLLVPYVAIPLAVLICTAQFVADVIVKDRPHVE